MTAKPTFNPSISLGTAINIITTVALMSGLFFVVEYRVSALEKDLEDEAGRITKIEDQRSSTTQRLSRLETQMEVISRQQGDLNRMTQQILFTVQDKSRQ
jgi:hypothetical protein